VVKYYLYAIFGYETARLAISELIEYEPDHVENTITILLTEIPAYRFLLENVDDDLRYARLKLRFGEYRELQSQLLATLKARSRDANRKKADESRPALEEHLASLDGWDVDGRRPKSRSLP
jgi:hypothetical protein